MTVQRIQGLPGEGRLLTYVPANCTRTASTGESETGRQGCVVRGS